MMASEEEETLSLSDLQFNNEDSEEISSSSPSSSSLSNQDFFSFSSEEWTSTSISDQDIIFCGKVIPHLTLNSKSQKTINPNLETKNKSLLRWNSDRDCRRSKKDDVVAQRLSKVENSRSKSRWEVFMFGSGRFPAKMELTDIRSRQLRRSPSEMFRSRHGEENGSRRSGRRLSGLIRVLGCGGGFKNEETIMASFGYVSAV